MTAVCVGLFYDKKTNDMNFTIEEIKIMCEAFDDLIYQSDTNYSSKITDEQQVVYDKIVGIVKESYVIPPVSKRPNPNKIDDNDFVTLKPDECGNNIG